MPCSSCSARRRSRPGSSCSSPITGTTSRTPRRSRCRRRRPCSPLGQAAGAVAIVLVGVSMAVVGQVYQLGADPWGLFAIWAAFALSLALVARSDAYFAVWFLIASTAYNLWAEQVARPLWGLDERAVPASFAVLAALVLLARDFLARPIAGPQPRWQRWLFAFAASFPAGFAGVADAVGGELTYGTAVLFALSILLYVLYLAPRPDRPTRSLALFALAVWFGAAGVRWLSTVLGASGAGDASILLLLSALWVIAVTGALAWALMREGRRA
ncbi:MAG: DUF2157 domain-containing protein [Parvularculaceae bacterium]|nr:DUF2157 domain-containing protein [Parvularculaceae bacterium]